MSTKIAVVTGGNKGIGFAIVRGLCEKFNGQVYLTSRDVARGEAAVNKLKFVGLTPLFHQLDIDDEDSVTKFKDYLVETHGGIDLLVNNASIEFQVLIALRFYASGSYQLDTGCNYYFGVSQSSVSRCIREVTDALNQREILERWVRFPQRLNELESLPRQFYELYGFQGVVGCIDCTQVAIFPPRKDDPAYPEHIYVNRKHYHSINVQLDDAAEPFSEQARITIAVNYFSTLRICESLFPILRDNARVVNVSSSAGQLKRIPSADLRAKFGDPELTVKSLNKLMEKFVKDAAQNKHEEEGWGNSAFVVSKVGVSALTIVQQRDFNKETPNRNISVNCCHPGRVDVDKVNHKIPLTFDEGAKAPLYLSLENHNLKGKYVWLDTKVVDWYGDSLPSKAPKPPTSKYRKN